jgi:hypothetical protein
VGVLSTGWTEIKRVVETANSLYFYHTPKAAVILPKRYFENPSEYKLTACTGGSRLCLRKCSENIMNKTKRRKSESKTNENKKIGYFSADYVDAGTGRVCR